MARPKREPGVPEARDRMLDAFWELLEDNECDKITVSMVCEKAGCYRGTFYYHFDSMEDLEQKAIAEVLYGKAGIQSIMDLLSAGVSNPEGMTDAATSTSAWRLALIARRGKLEMVESEVQKDVVSMWRGMLCDGGEDLAPDSKAIIEAVASLCLTVFVEASVRRGGPDVTDESTFTPAVYSFMGDVTNCALGRVCEVEGLSIDEVRERVDVAQISLVEDIAQSGISV